jgi:energy-coupling factor transporter ATP-binding protein EcfA2
MSERSLNVLLDQHVGIVGRTGSGKTFLAKLLAETILQMGRRLCVLDPTDAWHGLRSSADGKKPGFPVIEAPYPRADQRRPAVNSAHRTICSEGSMGDNRYWRRGSRSPTRCTTARWP